MNLTSHSESRSAPTTRTYRDGLLVAADFPLDDVSDQLDNHPDNVVWIDLCEPEPEDLHALAAQLSLHELAVEDALRRHQRPKLDLYDTHQFLAINTVRLDAESGRLDETQIAVFISQRWFITIRKNDRFGIDDLTQRWDRIGKLAHHGASYLLYGLLDLVVDEYFAAVDAFDDYYDAISQSLFDDEPLHAREHEHWFRIRQSLVRFHRLTVTMREAISAIMRREHGVVAGDMYPYYQDVYDHVLRIADSTDALRDLGATIVETNLALRDFRQNQVTKKITSWAAIIAVPTLITGFYGMNVPYPGSGETAGVIVSTVLAVGVPAGLYVSFRRRDWL